MAEKNMTGMPYHSRGFEPLDLTSKDTPPTHFHRKRSCFSVRSFVDSLTTRRRLAMAALSFISLLFALKFLILPGYPQLSIAGALPYLYKPTPNVEDPNAGRSELRTAASGYWMGEIKRQGRAAFNANPSGYQVFRNVKDFGARGDGVTDDTDAINNAVSSGSRCGRGCDSTTVAPALVYFPPGTYLVSRPIVQWYLTQFVGDAIDLPVLKASPGFLGIAVIDANPYEAGGVNWFTNQNNFMRQVRNFVIDLTAMPANTGTGIHWQVAQATSLQNIRFEMIRGENSNQQGIFMENGSGGFMTDLIFNGGNYGAFFGNQQFTARNLTFNDCKTAIFMVWNWVWLLKSVKINNCGIGIDIANGGNAQTVGSLVLQDSKILNTRVGISTSFGDTSTPETGGTLVIDNVDFTGSGAAVSRPGGPTLLSGNSRIASWAQGKLYTSTTGRRGALVGARVQQSLSSPSKPQALLNSEGSYFERSKPQYERYPASAFVSVKSHGAKGDGRTDDTAAIQAVFDRVGSNSNQIAYFDHGAYIVSRTIRVPKNIKITGEIWPLIMASGQAFQDESRPAPVFQVGQPGDVGEVEMSDLMFETVGPQPGAIMIEWNLRGSRQGSSGMWDVHTRMGGSAGTQLQSDRCLKTPNVIQGPDLNCRAAFLLLHVTRDASLYMENNWFWTSDHELDRSDFSQINIYNGRGILIESQGPVWLYGTAPEHNQFYNYQLVNAKNVYMGVIQTETPYFQANPNALVPFRPNRRYADPDFSNCTTDSCRKAWGLRILGSSDIFVYGAGLYSFFENYSQTCLQTESCQENMVYVENSKVHLYGLSTKASTNMVTTPEGFVRQSENRNNFCSTLALFESGSSSRRVREHGRA